MKPFTVKFKTAADKSYLPLFSKLFSTGHKPDRYALRQILTEAYNNARKHGARNKKGWIEIEIKSSKTKTFIRVTDEGRGFRTQNNPPKKWSASGRGVLLIKALADTVTYKKKRKGFCLEAVKYHV